MTIKSWGANMVAWIGDSPCMASLLWSIVAVFTVELSPLYTSVISLWESFAQVTLNPSNILILLNNHE